LVSFLTAGPEIGSCSLLEFFIVSKKIRSVSLKIGNKKSFVSNPVISFILMAYSNAAVIKFDDATAAIWYNSRFFFHQVLSKKNALPDK
jgi:hypothetical protein